MTDTLADTMQSYYASQLGHQGSLIELEREYFQAATNETWADAALDFYGTANGSSPVGSLSDEIFKYYSQRSGLSPAANYSLADHMYALFGSGGGHAITPPITDQLEAFFDAGAIDGYQTDARVSKNMLSISQATALTDVVSGGAVSGGIANTQGNLSLARSTAAGADVPFVRGTLGAAAPCGMGVPIQTAGIPVVAGRTYTGHVKAKAVSITLTWGARLLFYDSVGTQVGSATDSVGTALTTSYVAKTVTAVAPANAAYCSISARIAGGGAAADTYDMDDLGLWEGSSTDWVLPGKLHPNNLLTYDQATVENSISGFSVRDSVPTLTRSTVDKVSGSASLLMTSTVAVPISFQTTIGTSGVPVVAGKTYTVVMSAKAVGTTRSCTPYIIWFNSAGAQIGVNTGTAQSVTNGAWVSLFSTGVAPVGAAFAALVGYIGASAIADGFYFDNMGLWEGAQTEWVPPYRTSRPVDGDLLDFWRDLSGKNRHQIQNTAANKPLYREFNTAISKNLVTPNQASWETDTTGVGAATNATVSRITTAALHGNACLQVSSSAVGYFDSTIAAILDTFAGRVVTAVVWAKAPVITGSSRLNILWRNAAGGIITTSSGTFSDLTTSWQLYSVTATAPALAASAQVFISSAAVGAGNLIHLDQYGLWFGSSLDWIHPGVPSRNLLTFNQASVETDTTGLSSAINCSFAKSALFAAHGTASLELTSTGSGNTQGGTYAVPPSAQSIPVSPNTLYTFAVSVYAPVITVAAILNVLWYDSAGVFVSGSLSSPSQNFAASWKQLQVTGTSPAGAAFAVMRVAWLAVAANEKVYLDKFMMTAGYDVAWKPPAVLPNSKPSVQFDGVNDTLQGIIGSINMAAATCYLVVAPNTLYGVTNRRMFQIAGAVLYYAVYGTVGSFTNGLSTSFPNTAILDLNTANVLSGVGTATDGKAYKNGVVGAADPLDPVGISAAGAILDIGCTAGGAFYPGQIMAILIYSGSHTDAQRQQIERWLGARYGVSVL